MSDLPFVDAAGIARALNNPLPLIERLRHAFASPSTVPVRHHHTIEGFDGKPAGTLLLMPAWSPGGALGLKAVSVFPGNSAKNLPSVLGLYLLFDAATGQPKAVLDGRELTLRRTAAASALAARFLAPKQAKTLLMVGAGALAPYLIEAHCAVRPINQIYIWNRTAAKATLLTKRLREQGKAAQAITDLRSAVMEADIISCATMSERPLIHGEWLHPGIHLDLVGGYTPRMREVDDEAVRRAQIFVDTRGGALKEAGDLTDPIARGVINEEAVLADLFDLCRDKHSGRSKDTDITLFKSVGTALEDLAAAELIMEQI